MFVAQDEQQRCMVRGRFHCYSHWEGGLKLNSSSRTTVMRENKATLSHTSAFLVKAAFQLNRQLEPGFWEPRLLPSKPHSIGLHKYKTQFSMNSVQEETIETCLFKWQQNKKIRHVKVSVRNSTLLFDLQHQPKSSLSRIELVPLSLCTLQTLQVTMANNLASYFRVSCGWRTILTLGIGGKSC